MFAHSFCVINKFIAYYKKNSMLLRKTSRLNIIRNLIYKEVTLYKYFSVTILIALVLFV